jgi:hypothetical protein
LHCADGTQKTGTLNKTFRTIRSVLDIMNPRSKCFQCLPLAWMVNLGNNAFSLARQFCEKREELFSIREDLVDAALAQEIKASLRMREFVERCCNQDDCASLIDRQVCQKIDCR